MHLYNAWLPPQVAEDSKKESNSFKSVIRSIIDSYNPQDPDSIYSTLKWISVIRLFITAKSTISSEDVTQIVEFGLEVFHAAENKLHAQVRWGRVLVKLLKKHGKRLSVKIQWRPLYDCLMRAHFKKNTGPEGWRLRQRHFETVTSLIQSCRKFFPAGAASEIWNEFRVLMDNPWHNSSFEGSGFLRLFLPVNAENQNFLTGEWIWKCLDLWASVPNCQFWNVQWASIIARCIKNCKSIDWECYHPVLFTRYLNMFEVPVSNSHGSYPFPLEVPKNTRFLFSSKMGTPAKAIAKSIVYLLRPGCSAQIYFERLANLLEQFYHPSNGGRWSTSLERFLRHLVICFQYRLRREQIESAGNSHEGSCLGKSERASFVKVILKLIDRGQYSKNESLAETVSVAMSLLSYVEPSLVLPFIATRFQLALETTTATHQLKTALTSVAYTCRALILSSCSTSQKVDDFESPDAFLDLLAISLSNALLGMDANDPPKTLATMQLLGSVFSNLATVGGDDGWPSFLQTPSFSEWLDEFFYRLFSLLQHLEPSSIMSEGVEASFTAGTFLVEDPYYFCMLQVLLGKLSPPLFNQALKQISKFVNTNILPGATAEVGLLCCACVYSNPGEAVVHLVKPLLVSIISSLDGTPVLSSNASSTKSTISPALETAIEYRLKVLSTAISYVGPALLFYKDELRKAIASAFQSSSWKVNGAGDHLLRSLLGSLLLYYPIEQYKAFSCHPATYILEEWGCSKIGEKNTSPKWHIPNKNELSFAKELLDLHLQSALDELVSICQNRVHSDAGNKKDHLKVTLLRIYSSLQGVMSCLPDIRPCKSTGTDDSEDAYFLIAGAIGSSIGSSELRETTAQHIHEACRYLLRERSDDSILLILLIRIIDALGNHGSLEYEEWSHHLEAWKLESAAIIEPPCNFIISSHVQGKRRPRWALVEKAYMHNIWRASQSSYHQYRLHTDLSPPDHLIFLVEDLLDLSLHNYETVRVLAGRSLSRMLKRCPSLISKCVYTLSDNLRDPKTPEHVVLGSCTTLATQTVLRHFTTDASSFASFIRGLLSSSHHESLKAQKAITELFVKYTIHFSGIPRSFFKASNGHADGVKFSDLVSYITSSSFDTSNVHWRYNLMANRVLLLLILASRGHSDISSKLVSESTGHFLRSLNSELPQSRMLAVSALGTLLQGASNKSITPGQQYSADPLNGSTMASSESSLSPVLNEDGFFHETLNSLSNIHIVADVDGSSKNHGNSSFQSLADKAITFFYFDFSASWPRTPSWVSLLGGANFYSNFARILKRVVQEYGSSSLPMFKNALDEFSTAKERSKQCVAAEAIAGILQSDISGLPEAWDSWIMNQLQKVILASSVDSNPEWAACIRYAVTGKGKYGNRIPLMRQKILDFLKEPLPHIAATNVVAKRYLFLSAALLEISAPIMSNLEVQIHGKLLEEMLDNMSHSSAQVREVIGVTLAILCSNMRLFAISCHSQLQKDEISSLIEVPQKENWAKLIIERASASTMNIQSTSRFENGDSNADGSDENCFVNTEPETDMQKMETMLHFIISALKSGRSSYMLDLVVGLLYPVISLQETSNKDLSTLAKAAFDLIKWRILPRQFVGGAVSVILSSVSDTNWRTRSATLAYLRTFMYRHTFILVESEKSQIWKCVEKLLVDSQIEVREHAAGVLASLLKGGDEELSKDFRDRAFAEAQSTLKKRNQRKSKYDQSIAAVHGAVLALVASVLSAPYDMPSWLPDHVTLLARFISEPSPVRSTVTKAVAEFRRTHADTWNIQKASFSEEQLEVLADTSSSSSYFA